MLVIAVVVVAIVVSNNGSSNAGGSFDNKPVPKSILTAVTSPGQSELATVGSGGVPNPWTKIKGRQTPFTLGGKPELLYYGAEFCPYCAAERWGMIAALSRFGTFKGLGLMKSTANDVFPSTNTFTFRHASYTSPYLAFSAREVEDRNGRALQTPTAREQTVINRYDKKPYSTQALGFPFLYLDGKAVGNLPSIAIDGALHANTTDPYSSALSWSQIAGGLVNAGSPQARAVFGNANWITAGICRVDGNKPASVCSAKPIPALEAKLKF